MNIFKYLAFSALMAISVSGANAQDYDKGSAAYDAGDFKTAFKEWIPLAESGDALTQLLIGSMYDQGKGVIQSYVEAVKWYRFAADQGNATAQYFVGASYANGKGVEQNDIEAIKWFRLAADQGDATAQNFIGMIYENGSGSIQNDVIAHMWYNVGSANGSEDGEKNRGMIEKKMTHEEIAKAQAMAQDCMSSGYKNCGQ